MSQCRCSLISVNSHGLSRAPLGGRAGPAALSPGPGLYALTASEARVLPASPSPAAEIPRPPTPLPLRLLLTQPPTGEKWAREARDLGW